MSAVSNDSSDVQNPQQERLIKALRHSLLEIEQLKRSHKQLQDAAHEPIAIVAMSCCLPGEIDSPEQLWQLLCEERSVTSNFPRDRYWDQDSLTALRPMEDWWGGFIDNAAGFDADFFGISDREALAMDPQQRLLLEASWRLFEQAGICPPTLKGTATGVYLGVPHQDYLPGLGQTASKVEGYRLQGGLTSIASGRLAYFYGFNGPAVTVDTACSSSLTAIHSAVKALRNGETTMAVAGGATVMATPEVFLEMERLGGIASDGCCRAFSEEADGTVFSEGVGLLLLERYSDALKAGRPILAVLRGTAINQDGNSNGLTAPSGPAQEAVIRQALADAQLSVGDIDAVEAHGTGTSLGDPIEANALLNTYGRERVEQPLWLGSIKSNIGHTQTAAGVIGIIKMVLAMQEGVLPRTLYAERASSKVAWSKGAIKLLDKACSWPDTGKPRRAAVSSFGFSGTNAHVILEQAPEVPVGQEEVGRVRDEPVLPLPGFCWPVSAASSDALQAKAGQLAKLIAQTPVEELHSIGYSLVTTRPDLDHRMVVTAATRDSLLQQFNTIAKTLPPSLVRGVRSSSNRTAFLFSGQGCQWALMGQQLYTHFAPFRRALDTVCEQMDKYLATPLQKVMFAAKDSAESQLLDRTDYTQPSLFAFEVAMYRTLRELGVVPDYLAGHSIGEIAAVHVAGGLSMEDACLLVATRGRLMQSIQAQGAMVAIEATETAVLASMVGLEGKVSIAAVNGPTATVISGDHALVNQLGADWREKGVRTQILRVSHGFHSPHLDAIVVALRATAAKLNFHPLSLPIVSTLTGETLTYEQIGSPDYWADQARQAVRFNDAIQVLLRRGVKVFVEVGPDATLATLGRAASETSDYCSDAMYWLATGRREKDEVRVLSAALSRLFVVGQRLQWRKLLPSAQPLALPMYPFQSRRYWLKPEQTEAPVGGGLIAGGLISDGLSRLDHPFLQHQIEVADGGWLFTGRLNGEQHPWLLEHTLSDRAAAAGTLTAELMLAVGPALGCDHLESLTFHRLLPIPEKGTVDIQLRVIPAQDSDKQYSVSLYFCSSDEGGVTRWLKHASGRIGAGADGLPTWALPQNWPPENTIALDFSGMYQRLYDDLGVRLGPAFQRILAAWQGAQGDIFIEAALPSDTESALEFCMHPTLLDAALQAALIAVDNETPRQRRVLAAIEGLTIFCAEAQAFRAQLFPEREGQGEGKASSDHTRYGVRLFDEAGKPVAEIKSFVLQPLDGMQGAQAKHYRPPYRLLWREKKVTRGLLSQNICRFTFTATALKNTVMDVPGILDANGLTEAAVRESDATVLDCPALSTAITNTDCVAMTHQMTHTVTAVLQHWLASDMPADKPLVVMTRGAVSLSESNIHPQWASTYLAQAPIWGLVRSVQIEHPGRVLLLDVAPDMPWEELVLELHRLPFGEWRQTETQWVLRNGQFYAPRLSREALQFSPPLPTTDDASQLRGSPREINKGGTVLITGGTGTLGGLLARHLVRSGQVENLLLASRRGADAPGAAQLTAELEAMGASVEVAACDFANFEAVRALLQSVAAERPLTAVVHAAGVAESVSFDAITPADIERVMLPKVDAAWYLHQLTQQLDLAAFVCYSSAVEILGMREQAHYGAANAFLQALGQCRRAQGLPASVIAWGMWQERSGMGDQLGDGSIQHVLDSGIFAMPNDEALFHFDSAIGSGSRSHWSLTIPARLDLAALAERGNRALLSELHLPRSPIAQGIAPMSVPEEGPHERLTGKARYRWLLDEVIRYTGEVLSRTDEGFVRPDSEFRSLGFDSLTSVELSGRLSSVVGFKLTATDVIEFDTPERLARYLAEKIDSATIDSPTLDKPTVDSSAVDSSTKAVSVAASLTKSPENQSFAQLLRAGLEQGRVMESMEMLAVAASLRPSFSADTLEQPRLSVTWLNHTGTQPIVFCMDSFIHAAGNLTYQRLSTELKNSFDLAAIALPGYLKNEPLPVSIDTLTGVCIRAITDCAQQRPFVLVGFSTGGLVAHAVAKSLAQRGNVTDQPEAVVLIDSFPPKAMSADARTKILQQWAHSNTDFWSYHDEAVTALAWYMKLFGSKWLPAPLAVPLLLLQAEASVPPLPKQNWASLWPGLTARTTLAGNHFDLVTHQVAQTAKAIREHLDKYLSAKLLADR